MSIPKAKINYVILLCVFSVFISGCYPLPVYIDNPVQDKSEFFIIGKTTKDEVRDLLGSPLIVEEDLSVEVFHDRGTIGALAMLFYVPVWYESGELDSWAIVKYKDNLVDEFDAGAFVNLKTKDFYFNLLTETLLVSWNYYRKIMDNNKKEIDKLECNVYISTKNVGSIFLDNNYIGYGLTEGGFFYEEIDTGEHKLQFCYNSSIEVPNLSQCHNPIEFKCIGNQSVYFKIYPAEIDFMGRLKKEKETIIIEQSLDAPEWISKDKVIVGQGTCYVDYSERVKRP